MDLYTGPCLWVWRALTLTLCVSYYRVPGEVKSRELELDPQPRRDHEQGGGAGLRKLDFFHFGLFLKSSATDIVCDSAQARQMKQQLRSAQVAGQWRRDTALTLPLFWRRSTVSPVFFGWYPRSSLHSFVPPPLPPVPVPNKHPRFCERKAKWSRVAQHSSGAV